MYPYRNNMYPMFGQLAFRQGQTRAVGLPLEMIDKLGASMTASYHRNRQAVSKLKSEVLNLPDSNSEVNKRIIENMSEEVKAGFAEYEKEGNWWNADDAVYDTMDKLVSDPRVKDLQQYSAQYSAIYKKIDEAKTSQYWKNLAHAYNQSLNKGIREVDADGNITDTALTYQGSSISDIDMTKILKDANELITGWKADFDAKVVGGGISKDNYLTDDGFQPLVRMYGKQTLETVDRDEIEAFVMNFVMSNPDYQGQVSDIARLSLFAKNGHTIPDSKDVVSLMTDMANYDPATRISIVSASPEFLAATANMNAKQKGEYYEKVKNDSNLMYNYFQSGIDSAINKLDNSYKNGDEYAYKDMYNKMIGFQQLAPFQKLVDKASYTKRDFDIKYDSMTALNTKLYEDFAKNALSMPISTPGGQINNEALSANVDKFDEITGMITDLQLQREAAVKDGKHPSVIKDLNLKIANLESERVTNQAYIDKIKEASGLTDSEILGMSRTMLETSITNMPNRAANNRTFNRDEAKFIYEAFSRNVGNFKGFAEEMAANGLYTTGKDVNDIFKRGRSFYNANIKNVIKNNNLITSAPYEYIGFRGEPTPELKQYGDMIAEQYFREDGTISILESNVEDRSGKVNFATKDPSLYHMIEKGKNKLWEPNAFSIKPVMMKKAGGKPVFEVTMFDPTSNKTIREVIQVNTLSKQDNNDYFYALAKAASRAAVNPKNIYSSKAAKDAKTFMAYPLTMSNVTHLNGKSSSGLTVASAITDLSKNDRTPPVITFDFNGTPLTYVGSVNDSENIHGRLYNGLPTGSISDPMHMFNTPPIVEVEDGLTGFEVFEKFAAMATYNDALYRKDVASAKAISELFKLFNE